MFVIGITGGIGAGKSAVAALFAKRGIRVLDADEISRQVTGVNGRSVEAIRELLGNKVVGADGALNRKVVATMIFSNRILLDKISAIIHKEVLNEMLSEIEKEREQGTKVLVLDVPIPVKKGFLDVCNQVWVVSSDENIRLERLEKRGLSREDALRRMQMQMTREEYEDLADIVITNDLDELSLETIVTKKMNEEFEKRGIRV
jgi:dephospho-CoA kinase